MEQTKIKIVICDDMPFIAENFKNILSRQPDFEIAATALSGKECLEAVIAHKPDIVLMDIQMDVQDEGILTLEKIKQIAPETKIIMSTIHDEDEFILKSFVLGANGYLVKTEPVETMVSTIREVYKNNVSLNANIARKILTNCVSVQTEKQDISQLLDIVATLTITEYEILKMIYSGDSYRAIADKRFVEESTIRSQVNKILKKFDYKTMKQLIKHLKSLHIFD